MANANCREDNMCMFCKHWLGKRPEVNYSTGYTKYAVSEGLCAKDPSNGNHRSDELCYRFKKELEYM